MAKSPEEMEATMIANLKEQTGKSLDQWLQVVQKSKKAKHGEIVSLLKSEHGVTHGYANLIAHKALKSDAGSAVGDDALVDAQYAGAKAALRPIYDTLVTELSRFGPDVEFAPKKAYVSLRRNKQFGIIQPSTATRVDVGINLKGEKSTARLEESASFNAMVSHRVRIGSPNDIDKELIGWLKKAYKSA